MNLNYNATIKKHFDNEFSLDDYVWYTFFSKKYILKIMETKQYLPFLIVLNSFSSEVDLDLFLRR